MGFFVMKRIQINIKSFRINFNNHLKKYILILIKQKFRMNYCRFQMMMNIMMTTKILVKRLLIIIFDNLNKFIYFNMLF